MSRKSSSLTPKQEAFVREYLVDLNGAAAARRAGYSARTAEAQASRLLTNVKVSHAICEAQRERASRARLTADGVIARLEAIATDRLDGVKVRPRDQLGALALLARHHGLFNDKLQLSGGLRFDYAAAADECRRKLEAAFDRIAATQAEEEAASGAGARVVHFNRGRAA